MVFNSIEECLSYIESAIESCMKPLSDEIKKIMDDVTRSQVRGWSNQIFSSVQERSGGMSAEAYFSNEGNWYSLITGNPVPNPICFNEAGTVWGKGATSIMSTAFGRCESEIPKKFLALMRAKGIPIS